MEAPTFGSRVAGIRRMKKISQEGLADAVKITPRYLSKIENDAASPSLKVALAIAGELGISLDFLNGTGAV
jgi:transcriptional regulator with XRE-family HTH domain